MIQNMSYPFFHENQVLTEGHLNSLVTYLEQQDRESRILDGSGIRCGLNVSLHAAGTMIKLSPGSGTTTKGYLLTNRKTIEYRYYQEFVLPKESEENYLSLSDGTRITLYELLENNLDPDDETEENRNALALDKTLIPAPNVTPFDLEHEMTVILHLEIVAADLTTCKIDRCDNEGFEHQLHWRALLIAKKDLNDLLQDDLGFNKTAAQYFHDKYKVHEARIPVPKFNCSNTQSYAQIHQNYLYICKMAIQHLTGIFEKAQAAYQHTLSGLTLYFDSHTLKQNLAYYENNIASEGIQYFYDHLKDVALAINEFTNAAFHYHCTCSLNGERYPNYLMAGSFRRGDRNDLRDDVYRHYFEPYCRDTASINDHKELLNLYKRVNTLITSYITDFVAKSATDVEASKRLFITPESRQSGKLGDLIPGYYYTNNYLLRRRWNPNNFAHQQPHNIPWYWQRENNDAADWMQDSNNALRFRLDSHNCYHIEGHLGMTRTVFVEAFNQLKEKFNLEIDLKVLEVKHTEECENNQSYALLRELKALYEIEAKELDCYLTKLFDMFKEDYQVEIKPSGDEADSPAQSNLEKCQEILEDAYDKIIKKFQVKDTFSSLNTLKEFIFGLNLRCPGDKDEKTPSYYIVDLEEISDELNEAGGKIRKIDTVPPLIIEIPGHHLSSLLSKRSSKLSKANVLYTDGTVEALDTSRAAYQNLVSKYVSTEGGVLKPDGSIRGETGSTIFEERMAEIMAGGGKTHEKTAPVHSQLNVGKNDKTTPSKIMKMADMEGADTSAAVMKSAKNVQHIMGGTNQKDALETIETLIGKEENLSLREDLLGLRGKLFADWYGSAAEDEKANIPLVTTTVIDKGKSYTFYEYNVSVAKTFFDSGEVNNLISMLADLVYKIRQTIYDDEIEADSSDLNGYINYLNSLAKDIALLLETYAENEQEIEIHKCLLLPIFIGIYQRCWASNFINIKLKYIEAKASILEPMSLPEYVHKHPEMKHIGGAPLGGTLIVVFKAYDESELYGDFDNIVLPNTWKGYTPDVLTDYEAYVDDMGQGLTALGGGRNEIIVADFCLSYRCCADTSSVEYVVFIELKLDIPDEVCNETERVQIQFTPDAAIPSGEHVEQDPDDGLFYFASAGLDAGSYEVTLSLNDKTVKRTITVFTPPAATYTVSPEDAPDTDDGKKVWTFQANETGMTYKWYKRSLAADDSIFDTITDTIIEENDYELVKIQRTFELIAEPEESLDFELVLLVINGPCRAYSTPQQYTYLPDVKWEITPKAFCNSLQTPQQLEYTPKNAQLTGQGGLAGKVQASGDGYTIEVKDISQDEYQIEMSLPGYDPELVDIAILQSPTASFQPLNNKPTDNGDETLSLTFTADEEGYDYQWYLKEEPLPEETKSTYTYSWDKHTGTDTVVELEVINNWGGERCSSKTDMKVVYEAVPVEPEFSITFEEKVCTGSGLIPIAYSPQGKWTELTGDPALDSGKYVLFDKETGDAAFNPEGLDTEKTYPIILLYNGEEKVRHSVEICKIPNLDFSDERIKDPEGEKRDVTLFEPVKPNETFTYIWISVFDRVEKELFKGMKYKHFWPPDVNSTLRLKLRVITEECTCDSPVHTFINHDGGSLHLGSLEYSLNTSLAVFEDDTQVPEDIKMYVEKIIETNSAILKNITPPEPDIDPKEYALTKIDSGAVTRRIGSNLENTNMILDKLHYMEFNVEGRERVETFIKATLASTSEILLAKTMDLDETTETFDYLSNVIPKTTALFKIEETAEAKPELMERLKTKNNIKGFIEVVGKL